MANEKWKGSDAFKQLGKLWNESRNTPQPRGPRGAGPHLGSLIRIAKADEQIDYGSYGNITFWYFDEDGTPTESDEESVPAYDWLLASGEDIASGAKLVVCFVGKWIILAAECPA